MVRVYQGKAHAIIKNQFLFHVVVNEGIQGVKHVTSHISIKGIAPFCCLDYAMLYVTFKGPEK